MQPRRSKTTVGEFQNVQLTEEEDIKLTERYGSGATRTLVEELSAYLQLSGKRYCDHYATLLSWAKRKGVVENRRPVQNHVEEVQLTPEQIAKNTELRKNIAEMLKDPQKLRR